MTSSAIMSKGQLTRVTCSRIGRISLIVSILWSVTSTRGASNSTSSFSLLVTNCGETYPRSICIPSWTSTVVSSPLEDSIVSTPSAPTWSSASAISCPIVVVVAGRDRRDGLDVRRALDGLGGLAELGHEVVAGLVDPFFHRHGVGSRRHDLQTKVDHLAREDRGRRGPVSRGVVGPARHLLDELRAGVLDRVLELDGAGDRHAVVDDLRDAVGRLEHDVAAARVPGSRRRRRRAC